jgi:hypothetical protein
VHVYRYRQLIHSSLSLVLRLEASYDVVSESCQALPSGGSWYRGTGLAWPCHRRGRNPSIAASAVGIPPPPAGPLLLLPLIPPPEAAARQSGARPTDGGAQ